MPQHPKLMIPGPVDVWEETLAAAGEQVLPYYGAHWEPIYFETIELLRQVFQTENDIFVMTAPGSGMMETCANSLFGESDNVVVVSNGPFADRAIAILRALQIDVIEVEATWGEAGDPDDVRKVLAENPDIAGVVVVANETGTGVRNPVRDLAEIAHAHDLPIVVDAVSAMGGYDLPVDDWNLDLVCTSSNKSFETPPGVGIVSVSERAWDLIDARPAASRRGWYYNLATWKNFRSIEPGARVSPATSATSVIVALRASLKRILEEETLAGHWARYRWAQQVVRSGLRAIGFEMLAADAVASPTVTAFWIRDDMESARELQDFMVQQHNIMLAGSLGQLAGQVLRIGHMGKASTPDYVLPCLLGIEQFLRDVKGLDLPVGSSLAGLG